MTDNSNRRMTKAAKGQPDGTNDLRVIFSADGKTVLHDGRPKGDKK
jgi:hypothetical protein